MTRLIDAEALRKDIEHLHSVYEENKEWFYTDVLDHIDKAPTVEERPQGEWEKCSLGFDCNKCGYTQIYEDIIGEYHFCPNCGADMRKGTT